MAFKVFGTGGVFASNIVETTHVISNEIPSFNNLINER